MLGDLLNAWRLGQSVANPAAWKVVGATSSALAGILFSALALARDFGVDIQIVDEEVQALAMGVAGVLYLFTGSVHIVTSEKVGILPALDQAQRAGVPHASGQAAVGRRSREWIRELDDRDFGSM